MCTGIEIAMLAAAAASTTATVMSANAAEKTADVNAELQRREGAAEQVAALTQAEKIRRAGRQQVSEANAALASSGVAIDAGTPVRIGEEITRGAESDAFAAILSGQRRATTANDQASITSWQGRAARTAGYVNAGGTLLGGAAKAGSNWARSGQQPPAPIEERSSR